MGEDAPQDTPQQQWWEAFPEPKAECPRTDPAIVAKDIEVNAALGKKAQRDFYQLASQAGIKRIIFYCGK
jgi:arsenical-resistance protein 2